MTRAFMALQLGGKNLLMRGMPAMTSVIAMFAASAAWGQASPSLYTYATRYDAAMRVTGTIAPDPDGIGGLRYPAVRNSYDLSGRLLAVEKGQLDAWQSEQVAPAIWPGFTVFTRVETSYDAAGRKTIERTSGGGVAYAVTQYSYNVQGLLECTATRMNTAAFSALPASACSLGAEGSQGPDRISRNDYDLAGQLLKVQKGYGTALQQDYATYSWSANGKRISVKDANGNLAQMTYDGFDRQLAWYFPSKTVGGQSDGGDVEIYGYDANGNRTGLKKRDGRDIAYVYDALDRMTSKSYPAGGARNVYYSYDLRGLQTAARFDGPAGSDAVLTSWDGFGWQASSTTSMGGVSRTLAYQYDADGNRTSITHPDGVFFTTVYDGLDRETQLFEQTGGQLNLQIYGANGLRSGNFGGGQQYGYDGVGRLTALNAVFGHGYDVANGFSYNPASQIVSNSRSNDAYAFAGYANVNRGYAVNGQNQYTSAGPASFGYDANGNLTTDGTLSYGYDIENRLVAVSNGLQLTWDPMGRLFQASGTATGITQFVYDGDQLALEYGAAGDVLRRYVHGAGDDDPAIWYEGPGLSAVERRYMVADQQGSVVLAFDGNFSLVGINSYDEYGITKNSANGALAPVGRFGYTGQAWIPELGMYHYKARIYSPTLGRFLQTDPIGYNDQVNLYAYVANDPVNQRDPTGMCPECVGALIGGLVDGGLEAGTQLLEHGTVSDWGAVGRSTLEGAVIGATGVGAVRLVERGITVIKAAREIKAATDITTRTTRAGETAARLESAGGKVKDISPSRVKEYTPNDHPKAPAGQMQRVKFDDAQPGSKGFKRNPSPVEREILKKLEK